MVPDYPHAAKPATMVSDLLSDLRLGRQSDYAIKSLAVAALPATGTWACETAHRYPDGSANLCMQQLRVGTHDLGPFPVVPGTNRSTT